jgi:predicted phosphoribosyltransferase
MFQNREEAGLLIANKLKEYRDKNKTVVLAIPRGGVIVGRQIANELRLPLDIIIVKKISAPNNPELAIGAIAPSNVKYIDWDLVLRVGAEQEYLDEEIKRKQKEIEEKEKKFLMRSNLLGGSTSLEDKKIIILVDDGIATGATVLAAIKYIKQTTNNQKLITILAVPVIAEDAYNRIKSEVDRIIALEVPESFGAVGEFYEEFPQVSDEEVVSILSS